MTHQTFFKIKPFRSKDHTDWVKSFPCCACGSSQNMEPHHLKGHGHGGSVKADDRLTMPLCHTCHSKLHHYGYKRFDNRHSTMRQPGQIYFINRQLGRAKIAGVLTNQQVKEARELIA